MDKKESNVLDGFSFQFTGTLSRQREFYTKLVMDNGGEILGVSSRLTYLVAASTNSASTKMQRAIRYGVNVIDEAKFVELLESKGISVKET